MSVEDFLRGPKRTALREDELVRAVRVRVSSPGSRHWFAKVGPRSRHFISRVAVAGMVVPCAAGRKVRIGLGAVGPTPLRAREAERLASSSANVDPASIAEVARMASRECAPIDDVRASAAYRRHLVEVLVARFLREALA